jgi:hypothetical protein
MVNIVFSRSPRECSVKRKRRISGPFITSRCRRPDACNRHLQIFAEYQFEPSRPVTQVLGWRCYCLRFSPRARQPAVRRAIQFEDFAVSAAAIPARRLPAAQLKSPNSHSTAITAG